MKTAKDLPAYSLRNETEADYRKAETVVREAFWNLYVPGCDEHYLAHIIRSHPDFIPELDFVAEAGDEIIGSIMFTRSYLLNAEGKRVETTSFGPVCVLPEYQRQGIGSALIRKGLEGAREMGFPAVVIYGDPGNYCRHGFVNGRDCGISNAEGRYPYALLVRVLDEAKIPGSGWRIHQSDVFEFKPQDALKFDAGFPAKEKKQMPSQVVFAMQCRAALAP